MGLKGLHEDKRRHPIGLEPNPSAPARNHGHGIAQAILHVQKKRALRMRCSASKDRFAHSAQEAQTGVLKIYIVHISF